MGEARPLKVASCPYCGCERLACPWGEEPGNGFPIICGRCGGLSQVVVRDGEPCVEKPSRSEALALREDDQVRAWLAQYDLETIARARSSVKRIPVRPPPGGRARGRPRSG